MENTKYGKRREGRWTPIRAKAQDTRANPNSWETHLVRKRWDVGLLRALSPRIMMMMMMNVCMYVLHVFMYVFMYQNNSHLIDELVDHSIPGSVCCLMSVFTICCRCHLVSETELRADAVHQVDYEAFVTNDTSRRLRSISFNSLCKHHVGCNLTRMTTIIIFNLNIILS